MLGYQKRAKFTLGELFERLLQQKAGSRNRWGPEPFASN